MPYVPKEFVNARCELASVKHATYVRQACPTEKFSWAGARIIPSEVFIVIDVTMFVGFAVVWHCVHGLCYVPSDLIKTWAL